MDVKMVFLKDSKDKKDISKESVIKMCLGVGFVALCLGVGLAGVLHLGW